MADRGTRPKASVLDPLEVELVGTVAEYIVGMEIPAHDYLALTEATLTDTWVYKTGGAGGTTVAIVTITYTDSGKGTIATVIKT
jgi:hypothetical protein